MTTLHGIELHLYESEEDLELNGWTDWLSPGTFNELYRQTQPNGQPQPIKLQDFLLSESSSDSVEWAKPSLEVMYVFLDNAQMSIFAKSNHSYLINTVRHHKFLELTSSEQNIPLYLFEPVKELVWMASRTDRSKRNDWMNFTNYTNANESESEHIYKLSKSVALATTPQKNLTTNDYERHKKNIIKTSQILLNNQPRIQPKQSEYFTQLQPFWYFKTNIPDGVHVFSFSLNPTEYQPSGSCNMAQVKKVDIRVDIRDPIETEVKYDLSVYSIGYNILRIQNGIGGLVFSN